MKMSDRTMELINQIDGHTCTQACLAMVSYFPIGIIIERFGKYGMNQRDLIFALTKMDIPWSALFPGTLLHSGWYLVVVPSQNIPRGNHQVLIYYTSCPYGFRVYDPAIGNKYAENGSDLISWGEPIEVLIQGCKPPTLQ
jgi:hypothetical protein